MYLMNECMFFLISARNLNHDKGNLYQVKCQKMKEPVFELLCPDYGTFLFRQKLFFFFQFKPLCILYMRKIPLRFAEPIRHANTLFPHTFILFDKHMLIYRCRYLVALQNLSSDLEFYNYLLSK